ncbi:hypothetical protein QLQ12_28425 [Actinoplanes sp. NEAU-A12]|uniref:PrgI family protein n=1 Tax=Actinoplanes sandaracinus TaxID=3045177 RepID=A0ABT6WS75_9ACTN|nr:hypothetical protein [Actinoplanes sandaracinus]MDI6102553.1 hypothetical protein [Actinoplanes sandaracinus]
MSRQHWIALVKAESIILLYAVLGVWAVQLQINPRYVDEFTIGICVTAGLLMLWQVPRYYVDRVSLTNKRLIWCAACSEEMYEPQAVEARLTPPTGEEEEEARAEPRRPRRHTRLAGP